MYYEASISGVFRILFWIFAIAFLIRLIANLALPHIIKKVESRMRDNARKHQEGQRPRRADGEVTIEKDASSGKSASGGDFVDYVEIKD